MKVIKYLLNKLAIPLLLGTLTPLMVSIVSKINTGEWLKLFLLIPKKAWLIFAISICLWLILAVIYKRIMKIRELDSRMAIGIISVPLYGWIKIGEYPYKGVIWVVQTPAETSWRGGIELSRIKIEEIDIDTPPRCPICKTEIEEYHNFFGGYIWKCVSCGFKKRNKESYFHQSDSVKRIVKREIEKEQEKRRKS